MNQDKIYNLIVDFLSKHYKKNEFIYPDVIKRHIHCLKTVVIENMDKMVNNNLLEEINAINCPICSRTIINPKIEDNIAYCTNCDYEVKNANKHKTKLYKMK